MSNPPGSNGKSIYNSKDLNISRGSGSQYYDYRAGINSTTADQLHARGALGIGSSVAPQSASNTQGGVSYHDFLAMISQAKTSSTTSQLDTSAYSEPRVSVLSAKPTPSSSLQHPTAVSPLSSSSLPVLSSGLPTSPSPQQLKTSPIQTRSVGAEMKTTIPTPSTSSTSPTAAIVTRSTFPVSTSTSYSRDPNQAPFLDSSTVASLVYGKKTANSKAPPSSLLDTIAPLDERSVIAQLKEEMALEKCQVPDSIILAAKQNASLSPEERLHQRYGVASDILDFRPDDFNEQTQIDHKQAQDEVTSGVSINNINSQENSVLSSKEKKCNEQGEHYDKQHEDLESRRLRIERMGKEHLQPKPSLLTLEERLLALHAGPSRTSSSSLSSTKETQNKETSASLENSSDELDAELEKLLEQTELEMEKESERDIASDRLRTPSYQETAEKDFLQANISTIYSELQSVGIKPESIFSGNNGVESEENSDDDDKDDFIDGSEGDDDDKVNMNDSQLHSAPKLSMNDKGVYYDPSTNKLVADGSSTQAARLHQARQAQKGEKSREVRDIISFVFDEVAVEEELEKANEKGDDNKQ